MKLFFTVITWVFMPLMMPIYALLLILFVPAFQFDSNPNSLQLFMYPIQLKWAILIAFFIFGVAAPGFSFMILHKKNMISTLEMDGKKERNLPLIITLIYGILLYLILMFKVGSGILPKYFFALPMSGSVVLGIMVYVNHFRKISLHAAGVGILTGFIFAFCLGQVAYEFWIIIVSVLVSGLVISSRIYLQKHQPIEVILGYSISTLVTFLVTFFYPN